LGFLQLFLYEKKRRRENDDDGRGGEDRVWRGSGQLKENQSRSLLRSYERSSFQGWGFAIDVPFAQQPPEPITLQQQASGRLQAMDILHPGGTKA
jgi:hypothetical protein